VDDSSILDRIRSLMDEEHALRTGDEAADGQRLEHVEEMLDQCWDLLRQRRARREFGENPDDAHPRNIGTVEGYKQ
jgi:hypothetical protein